MKRSTSIERTALLVLITLFLGTVILLRCMHQSADGDPAKDSTIPEEAARTEKRDPCTLPTTDPMFVQTSTAMIEGLLTVSCYDQNKEHRVIRNVIVDDSDTTHTTFEQIRVSQGPHVVKLSGNGYSPPCHVVQISDGRERTAEFLLVSGQ